MTSLKYHVVFKKSLFKLLLILLISFQKKEWWVNFIPIPRQQLRSQNTSVGMGLIELNEPFDTLNYQPFFKHCILYTILHIAFLLFIFV